MSTSVSIRFKKVIAFISACAMVGTTIPAGFVFAADTLLGPDSATIAQATPTYTSATIDASGHQNLNLSFSYNAEGFDAGDSFTYGWRASGGSDNDLGTINGVTESGSTTASDEIGSVSTSLPLGAQIANLELYIKSVTNSGSDSATLSNITLQGDVVPPPSCAPQHDVSGPTNIQNDTTGEYFDSLQDALADCDTNDGDTLSLSGDVTLTQQVTITRPITLDGNGNTIISSFAKTDNDNNSAIGVIRTNNVTIEDVFIDGTGGTDLHGINVYESADVFIKDATISYERTGVLVNGSEVTVENIHTNGNTWNGVDVDQGSGVTNPAHLTVTGTSQHGEVSPIPNPHIFVDDVTKDVTVTDTNNQYDFVDAGNARAYTLKVPVPTGLRYDNPAHACGDFTNVNYTQPKWDVVTGAVSYDYQALFNGSVAFSANYLTNQHPGGTFGSGTNGLWGFQVRSVDAYGQKSDWSPVCEITLDTVAPAMPVHLSPADNSTQNINDFYFDWTDVPGVVEYEFQSSQNPAVDGTGALTTGVWNNKANGAPDRDFLASSTIHSYGANGTWYWQVRAIDAAGNTSPWTTLWKMTIDLSGGGGGGPSDTSVITSPVANEIASGTLQLLAHYADENGDDNDSVQWAVRAGTCSAGTGTVFGNVDGHNNTFTWNHTDFSATFDTTAVANGTYCFIFNPTEDGGNANQRLTQNFTINNPVVDTTAPAVPTGLAWTGSDSVPVPDTGTTNLYAGIASWNANGESDFDHYVYVYWNDIASSSYNSEGAAWTTTTPSPSLSGVFNQGEGTHHFCVKAVDTSGNTSACSAPFTITYALPHEEEPELTPITLCKYVGETRQSGWGMTLTGGRGEVPYVISTTTDETGCVTVSVDLANGPWTATEEMREGYVQDFVDVVQGDQIFLDEDQTEAACEFYDGYEEPRFARVASFSQVGPTCAFFNSEVPSGGEGESGTSTESSTSGGSSSSGTRVGNRTILPQGEVLGASTTAEEDESFCVEPYITDTLGYGRTNNPEQVTRLQTFLNDHDNAGLAVTGVFETTTRDAVMDFQLRYADEILTPWGITNPTGLVHYTTRKKINELMCGRVYPLTQAQLDEIARVRDGIARGDIGTSTPEGTVAGASTTESEMGSPDSSSTEQVEGDGGGNTDGGAEPGFFQRLWNAIFG